MVKQRTSVFEICRVFLRPGLTSFGGPIAHLGYFRHEFVVRRQWLDEHAYADFVLTVAAFLLLVFWKAPPWLVVILCALAAGALWQ